MYTATSIKVVHEQSGKVEYDRERLLGIANKLMNFQSDSQQPFALVFDFSALLVDNLKKLIEIAVYLDTANGTRNLFVLKSVCKRQSYAYLCLY